MWLEAFQAQVNRQARHTAIVAEGQHLTYAELYRRAEAVGTGNGLMPPGARVLIAEAKPLAILERVVGAWIHGQVPVVIPHDLGAPARAHVVERIAQLPHHRSTAPADREGLILTTGGSTGTPRLAALSHDAIHRSAAEAGSWHPAAEHVLAPLPLYRLPSLVSYVLAGLGRGQTVHLFAPGTVGSVIQAHMRQHGIEVLSSAPSFLRMLFAYGSDQPFPAMRYVWIGGEPAPFPLVEAAQRAFPNAQVGISFGMTETGVRVAHVLADDPRARAGACGPPEALFEARIEPVAGVAPPLGELWLRGPTMFLGYLEADGSYSGLDAEGFLHTRDLMRRDADGCLYHLGRVDGLVKVGGLQVNPREVEQALREMPGVADAMCWAEPHEVLGHTLRAHVMPVPGSVLDEAELRQACQGRMARHMIPRDIQIVADLPTTGSGKRALRPASSA